MSLVATLSLEGGQTLFRSTFERLPGAELTVEDFYFEEDTAGRRQYVSYLWLTGCDPGQFVAATSDDETVESCRVVTSVGDRRLVQITTVPFPPDRPLIGPPFVENDITLIECRLDREGTHLTVRLPDRDALAELVETGEQIGDSVTLSELYTESPTEPRANSLTDKQRASLALASERGYFAVPRETALADLAAELDVSSQTLSRHIRVGAGKVIESAVESVEDPHDLFKDTEHEA